MDEQASQSKPEFAVCKAFAWGSQGWRSLRALVVGIGLVLLGAGSIRAQSPPSFIAQPRSQTNYAGKNLILGAEVGGGLGYQWRLGGTNIPGQTNLLLFLPQATTNNSGAYTLVVTNAFGSSTSSVASLVVSPLPTNCSIVAWGDNDYGQTTVPTNVGGIKAIGGGTLHTVAVKNDGTVMAWGFNNYGQTNVPAGLNGVTDVAAGLQHTAALKSDGTLVVWGYNGYAVTNVPAGLSGVTAIAAGYEFMVALKQDGTVVAWGYNTNNNELNVPANLNGVVAIAAGTSHAVALRNDGTVVAWGSNSRGQLNIPAGLSGVTAIATSLYQSVVLKSDGTLLAWGDNSGDVPLGSSGVTAVSQGFSHVLALKDDATVAAWGNGAYGQSIIPAGLNRVTAISAGAYHSMALVSSPPTIRTQPTNAIAPTGANATFTVDAIGAGPLTYQWRSNGVSIGNATNTSLALTNVQLSHSANYDVVVTDLLGSITSSVAVLGVYGKVWTGGGDDASWIDPGNWSGNSFPTPADSIFIGNGTKPITGLPLGMLNSLICQRSLAITSALVVTGAVQIAQGIYASGITITARGEAATFNDNGATNLTTVSMSAEQGGLIRLPVLTNFVTGDYGNSFLQAIGIGSVLDFPNVRSIAGPYYGYNFLRLQALQGGRLNLTNVTLMTCAYVNPVGGGGGASGIEINSEGANSVIDLSGLQQFSGGPGGNLVGSQLRPSNGGQILVPNLASAVGLNIFVADGTVFTLPTLTNYNNGSGGLSVWQVTGVGSLLNMPALQNIRGPEFGYQFLKLQATQGGRLNLTNVSVMSCAHVNPVGGGGGPGGIEVTADGTNSVVDLSGLRQFTATGGNTVGSLLQPSNGGQILVPNLANAVGLNLSVSGGMTFALPSLTNYHNGEAGLGLWQASGSGSVLDLPALLAIRSSDFAYKYFRLQASQGGRLNLRNVSVMSCGYVNPVGGGGGPGGIEVVAGGTNSVIDLSGLRMFSASSGGNSVGSLLSPFDGGYILAPSLANAVGLNLDVSGGSTFSLPALTNLTATSQPMMVRSTGVGSLLTLTNLLAFSNGSLIQRSGGLVITNVGTIYQNASVQLSPAFLTSPSSGTNALFSNHVFTVSMSGSMPLAYQWLFNGQSIPYATNTTLTLTNLSYPQMGSYSVVVTNAYGASTSGEATLAIFSSILTATNQGAGTVIKSPNLITYTNNLQVTLAATPGRFHKFLRWSDGVITNPRTVIIGVSNFYTAVFTNAPGVTLETFVLKQWEISLGGTNSDVATVVRPTADGGYLVAGESSSGATGNRTSTNFGFADAWVVKLSAAGQKEWERAYGGSDRDRIEDILVTPDGGCLLGGYSRSPGGTGNNGSTNYGNYDAWLVKIDGAGVVQWERTYGGANDDQVNALAALPDGGYAFVGSSASAPGTGNRTAPRFASGLSNDLWIVKVDGQGALVWDVSNGTTNGTAVSGNAVVVTPDGGLLVGGAVDGTGGSRNSPSFGNSDMWLLKLRADGTLEREQSYGTAATDYVTIRGLKLLPDGSSVHVGNYTPVAEYDGYAIRVSSGGTTLHQTNFGGSLPDRLDTLDGSSDGGLYFGGSSSSPPSGNKSATNFGAGDFWVVKTDLQLNKQWDVSFGGTSTDEIRHLLSTPDGGFIMAGVSDSLPGPGKTSPNHGLSDYWVVKAIELQRPVGTPLVLVDGLYNTNHVFAAPRASLVTIASSLVGATVYYTLDGSDPSSGSNYSNTPFTVTNTVTIRAVAYHPISGDPIECDPVVVNLVATYMWTDTTPGGGSVSVFPPGGTYLAGTVVTNTAVASSNWSFMRWEITSGGATATSTNQPLALVMSTNISLKAAFGTPVTLGTPSNGTLMASPANGPYPYGSIVRLSAIPNPGAYFRFWTGAASSQSVSPLDFVVTNSSPSVSGVFSTNLLANEYSLTVLVNGNGTVTKLPQLEKYVYGTSVTLTNTPGSGQFFQGWSGDAGGALNPLTISMDRSRTITASFGPVVIPTISISNATVSEGDSGTTDAVFLVSLSVPSSQTITVEFATTNGTALAGSDYPANSGRLMFIPGETSKSITVAVQGDSFVESDETFGVVLFSPTNANLLLQFATGTIMNDDAAPGISRQPQSLTVIAGTNVSFSVDATGSGTLAYQWRRDGDPLAGATSASLSLGSAATNMAGSYNVVVTNQSGSIVSAVALLTVHVPPYISQPPSSLVAPPGGTASFTVIGGGVPTPAYQWRRDGVTISGATNSTLVITNLQAIDGGFYSVALTNLMVGDVYGAVTSSVAGLNVTNDLKLGLVAHYPLDGDVRDHSGNGRHGSVTNMTAVYESGAHGFGLKFAGNAQNRVDLPVWVPSNSSFTISGWVKHLSTNEFGRWTFGTNVTIFHSGADDWSDGAALGITYDAVTGNIFPHFGITYSYSSDRIVINTNLNLLPATWHHLAGVVDRGANELRLFCNGVLVGSTSIAGMNSLLPTWSHLGGFYNGLSHNMAHAARLDDVRIYSRALQAAEISALMNDPAPLPPGVPLVVLSGSIAAGSNTFGDSALVQIFTTFSNASLYYSLDGSPPTFGAPFTYTNAFIVTSNVVIRALAVSVVGTQVTTAINEPVSATILPTYSLTVATAGGGTVAKTPSAGSYLSNSVVTITAVPAAGWTFLYWTGDTNDLGAGLASGAGATNTIEMNRARVIQAVFGTSLQATSASLDGGYGTVQFSPTGGVYPYGTVVRLSARPAAGSRFVQWAGQTNATINPLELTITSTNLTLSALFALLGTGQVTLNVDQVGDGTVTMNPQKNVYNQNETVTITATPTVVTRFLNWTGDSAATTNAIALVLNTSKTVTAHFAPLPPGTVVAWGRNSFGQTNIPADLSGVTEIAAGNSHTVALKSDGTVVAWGNNTSGESTIPVGLSGVTAIGAGGYHTVALKSDGTVVAWGDNSYGATNVPAGLSEVVAVAAGEYHSVALKRDGMVVTWGYNGYGLTTIPTGLSEVAAIAAGGYHTVALKRNGTVVAWGFNDYGQTTVPAGLSEVTAIAAGSFHTVALKSNGTAVAWQTTLPAGLSGVAAVAVGYAHTVVLKRDGTVVGFGDNGYGQTSVPTGLSGATSIAAGYSHTVAIIGTAPSVPPIIISPPTNQSLLEGSNASFTVSANGTQPLAYQWFREGILLSGATNASLGLTNLTALSAGGYSVVVTNVAGAVTSSVALLTIRQVQSLSFVGLTNHTYGDPPFTLSAEASSLLPVTVTLVSGPASLSGDMLTLLGAGTVVVRASQAGNATTAAAQLEQSFNVAKATQTIAFVQLPDKVFGDPPVALLAASSSSLLTVDLAVTSGPARLQDNLLHLTGAGAVSIVALQPGNSNYQSALSISNSFLVAPPVPQSYGTQQGKPVTNVFLAAGTSNLTYLVVSPPAHGVLTGTGPMRIFQPDLAYVGNDTYAYAITDPLASVTTRVDVNLTITALPSVFQFSRSTYDVAEGDGSALLTVTRNVSTNATVSYSTQNGSARTGEDFLNTTGSLTFTNGQTNAVIVVPLIDDPYVKTNMNFTVKLDFPSGGILGAVSNATVRILDNDAGSTTNSLTIPRLPQNPPDHTGSLRVTLLPAEAHGQWRLSGELLWRNSDTSVAGLPQGQYQVEFKPVAGYVTSSSNSVTVLLTGVTAMTNQYASMAGGGTGYVRINLRPQTVATDPVRDSRGQWRLQGEGDWRDSGEASDPLSPGSHIIEFKPVPGWNAPVNRLAMVIAGQGAVLDGTYELASAASTIKPVGLTFGEIVSGDSAYQYNGQLRTELGHGSGFVVKSNVVLTAAHVLFDSRNFTYATRIQWLFQRQGGEFEPQPLEPRGMLVFTGYAAQRQADAGTPGETLAAQQLDVAALYFSTLAGRGGYGGYLTSDAVDNEWLQGPGKKFLVGYPFDPARPEQWGQMHSTIPTSTITFQPSALGTTNRVFQSPQFISYPGNSGGPLYVTISNNLALPAAIYLGASGQSLVRAIDSSVVEMINLAAYAGATGNVSTNHGGNIGTPNPPGFGTNTLRSLTVRFPQNDSTALGAAWREANTTNSYTNGDGYYLSSTSVAVEFKPVAGFRTPTNRTISFGQGSVELTVSYDPELAFTSQPLFSRPGNGLTSRLTAVPGTLVSSTNAGVTGAPPYAFQWQQNGRVLVGATNLTLLLSNVNRTNSGDYVLTVSDTYGSRTSGMVELWVFVTQTLDRPVLLGGDMIRLEAGYTNGPLPPNASRFSKLQSSTNVAYRSNWTTITNVNWQQVNGRLRIDLPAGANLPRRYYQVIEE